MQDNVRQESNKNKKMILEKRKKKKVNLAKRYLFAMVSTACLVGAPVMAQSTTKLSQSIIDGTASVDIVDGSGVSVANPSIDFSQVEFNFESQTTNGLLGRDDAGDEEKIRVQNPTATAEWTVSIAAVNPTDLWTDPVSLGTYDFNDVNGDTDSGSDADLVGGQMTINPSDSGAGFNGVGACSNSDISQGVQSSFVEGVTNSIDLLNASSSASPYCRWDMTDVPVSQLIPASQPAGDYELEMVLTIS